MKNEIKNSTIKGVIGITSVGTGFVTVDGFESDVFIEPQFLNTALHGDKVEIILFPHQRNDNTLSGEVIQILERAKMEYVGTLDKGKNNTVSFIIPDDRKMYKDIFIPFQEAKKIKNNTKVLVRIIEWKDARKNPEGKILKVLGKKGDNNVEMESIVLERGFQIGFPSKVEKEARYLEKISKPISKKDITERRDFRNTLTFTIDPEDAKDFDDAISFKKISDDVYEIGIHIADVSHYVKEKSCLDEEALERGVSIYLVDRTIPMLPEALSNDLCSLNPNEDKLTFSVVATIRKDGYIQKKWFGRTVIHSQKRFSYEEAQSVLDSKKGNYFDELHTLNELAKILREKRKASGSLNFEKEEVVIKIDAKGKPIDIIEKKIKDSHKLIEEFMILANQEVATYLHTEIKKIKKGASVYRTHGYPKKDAVKELLFFLRMLGHEVQEQNESISSKELNSILEKLKGKPEESLVKTVAMRSMAKAIYSIKNTGHYGLALENYTHFTSPIRRYADVLVHRILTKHLAGKHLHAEEIVWHNNFVAQLSQREIDATDAERSSVSMKQVEYMLEHIGEVFEGIISGITTWGMYIEEIKTKTTGMVKFRDMKDDFYIFNKETYSLTGEKKKKKYAVGDTVKIKIIAGDLERKTLDYILV